MSVDDVTEILAVNLLGVIPDDEQVVIATNRAKLLLEKNVYGILRSSAADWTGEDVPVNDYSKSEGFFGKTQIFHRKQWRKPMSVHSVSIAKYRLKNLLAADRMHCTADLTEQMKNDLYHAVSKIYGNQSRIFFNDITDIHIKYMEKIVEIFNQSLKKQYHKDYKFDLLFQ